MDLTFALVVERIVGLVVDGLTSTMVVGDFLTLWLAPLRLRIHIVWLYIGINDLTAREHGPSSKLTTMTLLEMLRSITDDNDLQKRHLLVGVSPCVLTARMRGAF